MPVRAPVRQSGTEPVARQVMRKTGHWRPSTSNSDVARRSRVRRPRPVRVGSVAIPAPFLWTHESTDPTRQIRPASTRRRARHQPRPLSSPYAPPRALSHPSKHPHPRRLLCRFSAPESRFEAPAACAFLVMMARFGLNLPVKRGAAAMSRGGHLAPLTHARYGRPQSGLSARRSPQ